MTDTPSTAHQDTDPTDGLTAAGARILTVIGRRELSFFDEGIVEGGGIWHSVLTGELAGRPGLPATLKGVALVVRRLDEVGMLDIGCEDEGDRWVTLTAEGARRAVALAEANPTD